MTIGSRPEEPFTHDYIIYVSDVRARIEWLEEQAGSEDECEELGALRKFIEDITLVMPTWGKQVLENPTASLIRDDYWPEYAYDRARDAYGEAVDTPYWDNDAFAEAMREQFESVEYEGTTYWGDGA